MQMKEIRYFAIDIIITCIMLQTFCAKWNKCKIVTIYAGHAFKL